MRNYTEEFYQNIKLTDTLLTPLNQGISKSNERKGFLTRVVRAWPIWYCVSWMLFYSHMIFVERATLEILSKQLWCAMSIVQTSAKLINGVVQIERLKDLLKWCEGIYTTKYKPEYQIIVNNVFEKTNFFITLCIGINTFLVGSAVSFYLLLPIQIGDRALPTPVTMKGNSYWDGDVFYVFYAGQILHGQCVFLALTGYDAIFILCIMLMTYRFRTMCDMLNLLNVSHKRDQKKDKEVLVDLYKMHLDVLEATEKFRDYYFYYGLVQLGNNLLCNCSILYILQVIGYDISSLSVLIVSVGQVLIACAFGQQLQNQANVFSECLYNTDWIHMTIDNKKRLLLVKIGSHRKVNIRAGGIYELNLALFVQIMKTGATLCAVMKAM